MASPGVRARILIAVSTVVLISVLVLGYTASSLQRREQMRHFRDHQYSLLQVVQNAVAHSMIENQHEAIQAALNQLRMGTKILSLRITDPEGVIHYSTASDEIGERFLDSSISVLNRCGCDSAFVQRAVSGGWRMITMAGIDNSIECQSCHGTGHAPLGFLAMESDLAAVDRAIRRSQIDSLYMVLISLLLAGVAVTIVHVRFIKRGLRKVLSAIGDVEKGNFQTYIDIRSRDELGTLAASFNSMIRRLNEMRDELKRIHQTQMERADKLASVGEVAAGIAHEIKNPMAGISSSIKVILDDLPVDDEHYPIFKEIIRQSQRVDNAINSLLTYARPKEPRMEIVEIGAALESSMKLVREQARRSRIDIELHGDGALPAIRADAELIEQALVNLLVNGLQAMPEGGLLKVAVFHDPPGDSVVVKISDTGHGIPPENLEEIFRPFYTTKHRGTGLGLAITRRIIQRHGGTIAVDSIVGEGTVFTITLPAHDDDSAGEFRQVQTD